METFYLCVVVFLFMLAVFDLMVGVSNDAVNFLNSAIGAKAAKFRTILIIAAIGVFVGATTSNGMMDIARHGIFHPQNFSFYELMCVFLGVMITDVILLDIFNTHGMPTSTTVSMVFELLGGAFVLALIKLAGNPEWGLGDLINAEKALSVILGIFVSVAIAFFFGTLIQWISRIIFTFSYKSKSKLLIAAFGGLCVSIIAYFLVTKGLKSAAFMTKDMKAMISDYWYVIMGGLFILTTAIFYVLEMFKVNVFQVVILLGTFSLAMAFAGNDLVNFIGVPLAGYSSFLDWSANAGGDLTFRMASLQESAHTEVIFLLAAGVVMVYSLCTSKKAQNVVKTEVGLSSQQEGNEMFGSSSIARSLVRSSSNMAERLQNIIPRGLTKWVNGRFDKNELTLEEGQAYDQLRASVNLMVSSLLIILGTALKLPLSTTYVTFTVAMGTSLADRAWGRESAVFRITGMLSVMGGWLLTAAAAFLMCALVTVLMYWLGAPAMVVLIIVAVVLLIRSNIAFSKRKDDDSSDSEKVFRQMMVSKDRDEVWNLLNKHLDANQADVLEYTNNIYSQIIEAFQEEDYKRLRKLRKQLSEKKDMVKKLNRQELLGMRRLDRTLALEFNTWYYLGTNSGLQLIYGLIRMCETCHEHVDNNFNSMPAEWNKELDGVHAKLSNVIDKIHHIVVSNDFTEMDAVRAQTETFQEEISALRKKQYDRMQDDNSEKLRIALVYLNMLQETQELLAALRHLLRANSKFQGLR